MRQRSKKPARRHCDYNRHNFCAELVMDFALILSRSDESSQPWTMEQRAGFVDQLRALDPDLGPPLTGDDDAISLVANKGIGLDWQIESTRLVVAPQVGGVKPERAEMIFNTLLTTLRTMVDRFGLQVHSTALQRNVDADTDHEALARAWLAHCHRASQLHLEATRQGSHVNLVAVLVLLAILLAASQMPAGWHPLITIAVAVPLAFLVLLWFRARGRRRAREE